MVDTSTRHRCGLGLFVVVLVVMLTAGAVPLVGLASPPAAAAAGDATPELTTKTSVTTNAVAGDTITYTITFTCNNNLGGDPPDGCDGAQFSDPLPKYTDVHGDEVPVEFVSATGPVPPWDDPPGFTLDASDPDNPKVVATAGSWPAGTSGVIAVTVRVPPNSVPAGEQTIENTASVTDPDTGTTDESTTWPVDISGTTPNWQISKLGPGDDIRVNHEYTWTISVCTDDPASAGWPIYDVTDTVPDGFEFISADAGGMYTDDGVPADTISGGAGTVTWHYDAANPPPIGDDGCFRMHVTGEFPSPDPTGSNIEGAVKVDTATGDGKTDPDDPGTDIGTDTSESTILGPQFGGAGIDKSFTDTDGASNFFLQDGDIGRFNLSTTVDSDFLLDDVVVTDGRWQFDDGADPVSSGAGMPESFTATSIDPGDWNDPVTATIEGSDDGFVTSTTISSGVVSGADPITLATPYRSIRWVWSAPGAIRGDFAASGLQIVGTVGLPEDDFGRYTNIATVTVDRADAEPFSGDADDDYQLENPQPHPGITKNASEPSRQPGQDDTYAIVVDNDPDATGDLVNPVVTDCIPADFALQGAVSAPAPWTALAPPACATGETPLSYRYVGTLAPGEQTSAITYTVQVAGEDPGPPAPYGRYDNTAFVSADGGGTFDHCQNTSPSCGDTESVTVVPKVLLQSQKCVRGELDDGVYRPTPACTSGEPAVTSAQTLPGGTIDYRLTLTNIGNVDAGNVDFVDILPHVGDTAVISETDGALNPRNSEFTPLLLTPIVAPAGWTVSYSTSANPCRPEVGGPSTGCDAPNWTSAPDPLAMSSYQSLEFAYDGVVARGDSAEFTWTMRAPASDPTYDAGGSNPSDPYEFVRTCDAVAPAGDADHCPRAVNSFAYGADTANLPPDVVQPGRLYSEPGQVEVRVVAPPRRNALGDRVWYDYDFDGIQDPGESGIPNVRVGLFTQQGVELANDFTDGNGRYLFDAILGDPIPDGQYVLRFYPPSGYDVSPRDRTGGPTDEGAPGPGTNPGTNTNDDSDLPQTPSGTDPTLGDYYQTVPITVGDNDNLGLDTGEPGETDPTWDLGMWRAEPAVDVVKVTKDSAWPDSAYGDGVFIVHDRPVTWRYTITNTGNTRLQDVTVSDDGGPDPTFAVNDCAIADDGENAEGTQSSATAPVSLNRGASMVCTDTGTAATTDYANDATVVGIPVTDAGAAIPAAPPGFPSVPTTVTDTDPSSYVSGRYDLALAKTVATPDLASGTVTFTITVRNQGNIDSGDHSVTDWMAPGLSVVDTSPPAAATTGTSASGVSLRWDLANLAAGADRTITVTAHIDDYLVRPYRNLAEISADSSDAVTTEGVATPTTDIDSTPDTDRTNDGVYGPVGSPTAVDNTSIESAGVAPDPEDDADIADLVPDIHYDLALAKVAASSPIGLGASPEFTFRVYNQGNVPSGPYTVVDQIPSGLTFDAAGSAVGCTAGSGDRVTCVGTNLQPGASASFTIATTIDGTPDNWSTAPWRNWAEIDTDSARARYAVDDVDSVPEATQGNGIGQDATLPGDAFSDVTTAGDTYVAPAGADEDDNDSAVVESSVFYDLALSKTASATPVTQTHDATITYTIEVQNQGSVPSGTYQVTDRVPAGLTVTDPHGGTLTANGDGTHTVVWSGAGLDPDDVEEHTLEVDVTDLTVRPYRNVAEISADSAQALYALDDVDSTPDADPTNDNAGNGITEGDGYGPVGAPDPGGVDNLDLGDAGHGNDGEDDADIADVTFPLTYDLALAKTVDQSTIEIDDTITYTITVQNQGVVDSHEFTVTDQVPDGLQVADRGGATQSGTTLTWVIDDLAPGDSTTRTFTATVDDVTKRSFRNVAEISADSAAGYSVPGDPIRDIDSTPDADPTNDGDYDVAGVDNTGADAIDHAGEGADPEDDADIADVGVDVRYDLALVKTGPATMDPLGTAAFTVTVQNQGNVPSGAYTVTDTAPAGTRISSVSNDGAVAADGLSAVWADLPSLDPGATATLTVTVEAWPIPGGLTQRPFTNFAEITSDSATSYSSATETVHDVDSTPGDLATSGVDNTSIDQAGTGTDAGFDDEDIATVDTNITYDLALIKTVDAPTVAYDGTATFTVAVRNQGNVPSGEFTVVDAVPVGLDAANISDGGVVSGDGRSVTWTVADLTPDTTTELTFDVTVGDITQRPFTNFAEITADSAAGYSSATETVHDVDSTPGDLATSGVDNTRMVEAGRGADAGFDDEDIAVLDAPVIYDLAIDKRLVGDDTRREGDVVRYEIEVFNQSNVPSGPYSFTDTVPDGMQFVAASDGGTASGSLVTWTDRPSLDPGMSATVSVSTRIVDAHLDPFQNVAEITTDSASAYSTVRETVHDVDSTPGNGRRGEDDDDDAMVHLAAVAPAVEPGGLAFTGRDLALITIVGGALLGLGFALVITTRRRRLRRSTS